MSDLDERITDWERRLEDILIEVMRYRVNGFAIHTPSLPAVSAAFVSLMSELRDGANAPVRPGLKRGTPAIRKMLDRACMEVDGGRVVKKGHE